MHGLTIAVLSVLNDEDHEKCDDSSGGIDDQLPGIAKVENRAEHGPNDNGGDRETKCHGSACGAGCSAGEAMETTGFLAGFGSGTVPGCALHTMTSHSWKIRQRTRP